MRVVTDIFTEREMGRTTKEQADKLKKYFKEQFIKEIDEVTYYPSKPINDAHKYVDDLNLNLTQSRVGIKLRKLTGIKE